MPPSPPRTAPPPTRLQGWLASPPVYNGILTLISINVVILGLETSPAAMQAWGPALLALDNAILTLLVVEIALHNLTIVPSMRRVSGGPLAAIPGLSSIAAVLGLIFYVFAVMATDLFGADKAETIAAVDWAREHIEADLHGEVRPVAPAAPVTPRLLLFAAGLAGMVGGGQLRMT